MRTILTTFLFFAGFQLSAQICFKIPGRLPVQYPDSTTIGADDFFKPKVLDTVIVSATYCPRKVSCSTWCGMKKDTSITAKINPGNEQIHKAITDQQIKTYPNPVPIGSTLNIFMQLNQTGPHVVVVRNAAGLLVFKMPVQLAPGQQRINLQTGKSWSRGMYFVSVLDQKGLPIANSSFIAG